MYSRPALKKYGETLPLDQSLILAWMFGDEPAALEGELAEEEHAMVNRSLDERDLLWVKRGARGRRRSG